jgi:hypothetical protein
MKHVAYLKIGMKMPMASSHGLEATKKPYRQHFLLPGVQQLGHEGVGMGNKEKG